MTTAATQRGVPQSRCTHDADAVFDRALNEMRDTYHDLVASRRCTLFVFAEVTGGRWQADCIRLVRNLARYRASSEPVVLRRSMQLAYQRRW